MAATRRDRLTRARILAAAVDLADADGITAVTMRTLGARLGVEAMSLYHHVTGKEDLLDGMADTVSAEFHVPVAGPDWRAEIRRAALSARAAFVRHPWAGAVLESRTMPTPARMRYLDGVLGVLRHAGFPVRGAYDAIVTLDSYCYGFALQETSWPADDAGAAQAAAAFTDVLPAGQFPHVAEMAALVAAEGQDSSRDFEVGLDAVLAALEAFRAPVEAGSSGQD